MKSMINEHPIRTGLVVSTAGLLTGIGIGKLIEANYPKQNLEPNASQRQIGQVDQQKNTVTCDDIKFSGNIFEGKVELTDKAGTKILCEFPDTRKDIAK
jgi:hypothetical protein